MSDGQKTRRRFLADLLFLGGALGAGAFMMQADSDAISQAAPTPQATGTPDPSTQCPPQVEGATDAPSPPPPEPAIDGEVVAPQPPEPGLPGKVAMPRPMPPIEREDMNIQGGFTPPTHRSGPERQQRKP